MLHGTPLNVQMVLLPQRLPLLLPEFLPDPLAILIASHLGVFTLKGNRIPGEKELKSCRRNSQDALLVGRRRNS